MFKDNTCVNKVSLIILTMPSPKKNYRAN